MNQGGADHTLCSTAKMSGPTSARDAFAVARKFLESDDPQHVFRVLDGIKCTLTSNESSEAALLRGAALVALARLDDAIEVLGPVVASGNRTQRIEAACELAAGYVLVGRLQAAEAVLSPFIDSEGEAEPNLAARALGLFGWIERQRSRRLVAVRYYLDALSALDRALEPRQPLRTALLHDVALAAVETLEPRLFARVRKQLASVAPTGPGYAALQRVRVLGELLCGDTEAAWEIGYATMRVFSSGLRYVAALVSLASVSHIVGDVFTATRLTFAAAEEANHVDWPRAEGSERQGLLRLVAAIAPVDARLAAALLAIYESLPEAPIGHSRFYPLDEA